MPLINFQDVNPDLNVSLTTRGFVSIVSTVISEITDTGWLYTGSAGTAEQWALARWLYR